MSTSITRDPGDGSPSPPLERTGWGGDGVGDGSLRAFLEGAVIQHFTKTLAREPDVDFRVPTALEADLTNTFQLALGRLNDLKLTQVTIFDTEADEGRRAFLDPMRGRCNVCHLNAGANFIDTGLNRQFDNGITDFSNGITELTRGTVDGVSLFDAGFGGQDLDHPNIDVTGNGFNNGFGNLTFSPPPLIEAADTLPSFHTNFRADSDVPRNFEQSVSFYAGVPFANSGGGQALEARFGSPLILFPEDAFAITRFLRALNAAFNIDIAKQRLQAAKTLANGFHDTRDDIQKRLMELALVEIDDALEDDLLAEGDLFPDAINRLGFAKEEIGVGLSATSWEARLNRIDTALSRCLNARDQIGSNINFQMGQGNLMF